MRVILVVVLVCVLLSLCTQSMSPEEIRQKAIESSKNIETCRFKMTMKAEISFSNDSKVVRSSMISNVNGAYDFVNRRVYMKMVSTMSSPEESLQIESESYLMNDTMYMKMKFPNGTCRWVKTEVKDEAWNRSNQIKQQVDLLKISEVERLPDERVNGTDCYVLELKPDLDRFVEYMVKSGQQIPQNVSLLKEMLKEVKVREWIAKDTFYPIKTEMRIVMEMPMSLSIGSLKRSLSMRQVMNMTIELYDINEPVNIELPSDAESAILIQS